MSNYIKELIDSRQNGILCGIPSYCTANEIVLRALIKNAKKKDSKILIEATSNQVNQDLGYTNMNPYDFVKYLKNICDAVDYSFDNILVGGDHLGPLPWCDLPASVAMDKAEVLVRMSVQAGYKKIHLDATMQLGDDPEGALPDEIIAKRSARLYRACEEEYQKLKENNPFEEHPVFVIGSEVPRAGGIRSESEEVHVTEPSDFEGTLEAFHRVFKDVGIQNAWEYIIAVVVQPGVDFGANRLQIYDRDKTKKLCKSLKKYPGIVFEGHSTDFQPKSKLKQMVEDGIAILKVGPALTFALRECLYGLSYIEDLVYSPEYRSNFRDALEQAMIENDRNWKKYYPGSEQEQKLLRAYGLSDRCRYYLVEENVSKAINKLICNLNKVELPMGALHQFLPYQYKKIRDGVLNSSVMCILEDHIQDVAALYEYATNFKYICD